MAVTVGTTAAIARLTMNYLGWAPGPKTEPATKITLIDGAYDNAELQTFLSLVDGLSLAGIPGISVSKEFQGTGQATTPTNADPTSQVNNGILLSFSQPNPLNAAKTVSKSFFLPAPVTGLLAASPFVIADDYDDGSTVGMKLRGVVDFLEDNMVYIDVANDVTVGGWTFDITHSAYMASPAILDGQ